MKYDYIFTDQLCQKTFQYIEIGFLPEQTFRLLTLESLEFIFDQMLTDKSVNSMDKDLNMC